MIKQTLNKLFDRVLDTLVMRAMPIILKRYYSVYAMHWHPHYALREEALAETVAYIKEHMSQAMIKNNEFEVLAYACKQVSVDGLFLEFGVRTGTTINYIAKRHPSQTIYGFDSFAGLPEEWSGWVQDKGSFAMDSRPEVQDNVTLVVGWFEQTLPDFLQEHPDDVAFVHIDSDLYASAKTVLNHLAPQIRKGTIIVFNEYFNYPNWQQHEFKAFQELCETYAVRYEYMCWGQFEAAVRIVDITMR